GVFRPLRRRANSVGAITPRNEITAPPPPSPRIVAIARTLAGLGIPLWGSLSWIFTNRETGKTENLLRLPRERSFTGRQYQHTLSTQLRVSTLRESYSMLARSKLIWRITSNT